MWVGFKIKMNYDIHVLGSLREKAKVFRTPKGQELVKLRKMIEKGDSSTFKDTVWENPHYLISSGDTPTILHVSSTLLLTCSVALF